MEPGTTFPSTRGRSLAYSSLGELLQVQATRLGSLRAFIFRDDEDREQSISFADLDRQARQIAAVLRARGKPGDRALLVYPAGLDFLAGFFGCLYAGIAPVPATYPKPRRPMPRMAAIAQDCGAKLALTTRATLETIETALGDPALGGLTWIAGDELTEEPGDFRPFDADPADLAFLQYTSGSTSEPKGVMVTHGNLLHNLEAIRIGFGIASTEEVLAGAAPRSSGVFWLPSYHDMGLIGGILTPLYVGGQSVLMSPAAFLQRPFRWLAHMSQYQATISGGPNFAYELCAKRATREDLDQLDLSNWQVAFCGAEPIRPETLTRFAETFAPAGFREEAFYPCYGLAEATLLAAGNEGPGRLTTKSIRRDALTAHRAEATEEGDTAPSQRLVGCGQAPADHELLIVDAATGQPRGEEEIGEIWLRGPSIARGYWNRPEASAQAFCAALGHAPASGKTPGKNGHAIGPGAAHAGNGNANGANGNGTNGNGTHAHRGDYLRTGDLGFVSGGQLYVTGRLKDMIIVRGRNYYPQDLERTIETAHEGLFAGGGASFALEVDGREEVVAVQEIDRQFREANLQSVVRRIRRAVTEEHDLDLFAVILIRQASLPRTTSGKVQRQLCREQYMAGELKVLTEWVRPARAQPKARDAALPHLPEASNADSAVTPLGVIYAPAAEGQPARPALTPEEIDRLAERIETWMTDWLVERASVPREEIERDKPFAELGLDSLTAVELSQDLEDWLHVQLTPVVAWNYPTPAALARYLAREAGGGSAAVSEGHEATPARRGFEELLAEVEALSEADAAKQLRTR